MSCEYCEGEKLLYGGLGTCDPEDGISAQFCKPSQGLGMPLLIKCKSRGIVIDSGYICAAFCPMCGLDLRGGGGR